MDTLKPTYTIDERKMLEEQEAIKRELLSETYEQQVRERQYRPYVPKNNSIAQLNRHTGEPHEHKREIARRLRQK